MTIDLNQRVRCRHSGYEGVAVSKIIHAYRTPEVKVLPERCGTNGERLAGEWFDEEQLETVK